MAIKKISILDFISLSSTHPVFDVRSPGEFTHAHFPGANSLPLFSDEERKVVGTEYKQKGKQPAIKIGLAYFGTKMKDIVEQVEKIKPHNNVVLINCWRGGMRSTGIAWLLDLYGYEVYVLTGGYKAFRTWVLQQFEQEYEIKVLGGYTGSAKTELLQTIKEKDVNIIDLEGLAMHKGSAFGGIGLPKQPTQEMFENKLALSLFSNKSFWLEDESQRIGSLNIPHSLWKTIRNAPLFFIEIPFCERLAFILNQYGNLDVEKLIEATTRIQKRLGPLDTTTAINYLHENKIKEAFEILLSYYDKQYLKAFNKRENINSILQTILSNTTDAEANKQKLFSFLKSI